MKRLVELEILYLIVGRRIRLARERAGLSQDQLAKGAGLSRISITNIEGGRQRVGLHDLYRIANLFSVSICTLLPENTTRMLQPQAEMLELWVETIDNE